MSGVSSGGQNPTAFAPGGESRLAHEPGHACASDLLPLVLEFSVNAWGTLPALVLINHLMNFLSELSIFSAALAGWALTPGIIATFRDFTDSTHDDHGKLLPVLFDKMIAHLDSREKMLTAFFSSSRSCWTRSSSRLRRRFSSSSAVWCPLPGNASFP